MTPEKAKKSAKPDERKRPGPKVPPLGIEGGDWEKAMDAALRVEKPAEGWPDHGPKQKGQPPKEADPE